MPVSRPILISVLTVTALSGCARGGVDPPRLPPPSNLAPNETPGAE